MRAMYAALGAQDVTALISLTAPDVVVTVPGNSAFGGRFEGYAGLAVLLTRMARYVDADVRTDVLFSIGDLIVQAGALEGRVRKTGNTFSAPEVNLWRISAGRVSSLHVYIDQVNVDLVGVDLVGAGVDLGGVVNIHSIRTIHERKLP